MNNIAKLAFVLGAFVILTILGYYFIPKDDIVVETSNISSGEYIFVHIEGEIKNTGLFQVPYGTRLFELIEIAGGETLDADLTRINLSSILSDEQKIVIPHKVSLENTDDESGMVNINTAGLEALTKLSGIGKSTAEKIISYREENGYFNVIEDLMKVPGIGQSKFDALKNDITL